MGSGGGGDALAPASSGPEFGCAYAGPAYGVPTDPATAARTRPNSDVDRSVIPPTMTVTESVGVPRIAIALMATFPPYTDVVAGTIEGTSFIASDRLDTIAVTETIADGTDTVGVICVDGPAITVTDADFAFRGARAPEVLKSAARAAFTPRIVTLKERVTSPIESNGMEYAQSARSADLTAFLRIVVSKDRTSETVVVNWIGTATDPRLRI